MNAPDRALSSPVGDVYGVAASKPQTDREPRCERCHGRKLAEWATRPWAIRCGRCKATTLATSTGLAVQPG